MSDVKIPGGLSPLAATAVLAAMFGLTTIVGTRFSPTPAHPRTRRWYKRLDKPGFTPPDPVFGVAWPIIESGLAWGGYRLMRDPSTPARDAALALFVVNTGMIGGWSAIFFGQKALGPSALAAGGMIGTGIAYAVVAERTDRTAAATALPFIGWLGFATLLATDIWRRNRDD